MGTKRGNVSDVTESGMVVQRTAQESRHGNEWGQTIGLHRSSQEGKGEAGPLDCKASPPSDSQRT